MHADQYPTAHVAVIETGHVYLFAHPTAYLFDTLDCGRFPRAGWPRHMGDEPEWFASELDECRDWYERQRATEQGRHVDLTMRADRMAIRV